MLWRSRRCSGSSQKRRLQPHRQQHQQQRKQKQKKKRSQTERTEARGCHHKPPRDMHSGRRVHPDRLSSFFFFPGTNIYLSYSNSRTFPSRTWHHSSLSSLCDHRPHSSTKKNASGTQRPRAPTSPASKTAPFTGERGHAFRCNGERTFPYARKACGNLPPRCFLTSVLPLRRPQRRRATALTSPSFEQATVACRPQKRVLLGSPRSPMQQDGRANERETCLRDIWRHPRKAPCPASPP